MELLQNWLDGNPELAPYIGIPFVIVMSLLAFFLTKNILIRALNAIISKSSTKLDDILVEKSVFNKLAFIAPMLVFYYFSYLLPDMESLLQRIFLSVIILILLLTLGSLLDVVNEIYKRTGLAEHLHIKSYIQIIKLIFYILGIIVIIAVLMDKSPWILVSGIGAMTAVLLLVFKETLLSFVASLQISTGNLIRIGDWIEVPKYSADGDVIDIALHTVKIQNWDKTITIIPTHKLLDASFKNWRGMSESGGRRIKRSIFIDMTSIKFCNEELINKFNKFEMIKEYIKSKQTEVTNFNDEHQVDTTELINGRRLTNIGTFRVYVEEYLKNHPHLHDEMTLLVRQLKPASNGLPIEIYVFTNDTIWKNYEGIQSDIFDHILAVIPEFELRVFQDPTGQDFSRYLNA